MNVTSSDVRVPQYFSKPSAYAALETEEGKGPVNQISSLLLEFLKSRRAEKRKMASPMVLRFSRIRRGSLQIKRFFAGKPTSAGKSVLRICIFAKERIQEEPG